MEAARCGSRAAVLDVTCTEIVLVIKFVLAGS